MMREISFIPFTKMQGLGNDFVLLDELPPHGLTEAQARHLCDRRFGIGADQILILKPPQDPTCEIRMEIMNADGSTAEMCGNGIRAVALYLRDHKNIMKPQIRVETLAGVLTVQIQGDQVSVDMGLPVLGAEWEQGGREIQALGKTLRFYEISMGNPHAVFFLKDFSELALEEWGPVIEKHPFFPKRTNVEFVVVRNPRQIDLRVWERGAGLTLACGTGACAAAVASWITQRAQTPLEVYLPGGMLTLSWNGLISPVRMLGPAKEVYRGRISLDSVQ